MVVVSWLLEALGTSALLLGWPSELLL